jgi:transposase
MNLMKLVSNGILLTMKAATKIKLTEKERSALESLVRNPRTNRRVMMRARIVLAASEGRKSIEISKALGVDYRTVRKWRVRFAKERMAGLSERVRSGAPPKYAEERKLILSMLDRPPPQGYSRWTGKLLAEEVGNVSIKYVERFLRKKKASVP